MGRFDYIQKWTEEDIRLLQYQEEDSLYEFKQNMPDHNKLADALAIAASAFWNSGGGLFIAGRAKDGSFSPINELVNRQTRNDWIDQTLKNKISPYHHNLYQVKLVTGDGTPNSSIPSGQAVLVVAFEESPYGPFMAFDNKFYIRAGAHSLGANYFLVEAIRARKFYQHPTLRVLLKHSTTKPNVIDLEIVAINDAVSLDVSLDFEPYPPVFQNLPTGEFPIRIPFIDRQNPYRMDLYNRLAITETFGNTPVEVNLNYRSITGHKIEYKQKISWDDVFPLEMGEETFAKIEKTLENVSQAIKELRSALSNLRFK